MKGTEFPVAFTALNDFTFCPASLYFHGMYDDVEGLLYKAVPQTEGTFAHRAIDKGCPSSSDVISGISLYCEEYGIYGKIDRYITTKRLLIESKKHISYVHEGYILQLFAQYFAMKENGFQVKSLCLFSIDDKRKYQVSLPEENPDLKKRFIEVLEDIRNFSLEGFCQNNISKCSGCIYSNICKWGSDD